MMLPYDLSSTPDWPLRTPAPLPPSEAELGDSTWVLSAACALSQVAADSSRANPAFALEVAFELRYPRLRHALARMTKGTSTDVFNVQNALDLLDEVAVAVRRSEALAPALTERLASSRASLLIPWV